ncbi:uncharacterized protein [Lolium perenne]|uniref:uncharacterized protein n=1 Tax=Lolium perenne TaxID=4522 RepID=UPI0021F64DDD|nr:uncharacterized protein LOC127328853 [Lolium perenne]
MSTVKTRKASPFALQPEPTPSPASPLFFLSSGPPPSTLGQRGDSSTLPPSRTFHALRAPPLLASLSSVSPLPAHCPARCAATMRMVSIHAPPPPTLSWAIRLACILSWASIPIPRPNSTLLPLVKFPPLLLPLPCFPCFAIARFVSDSELHRAPPSPAEGLGFLFCNKKHLLLVAGFSHHQQGHRAVKDQQGAPQEGAKGQQGPAAEEEASTANKAAAAEEEEGVSDLQEATRNNPSPLQQVQPELRIPTMPTSLSAFVQELLRLLQMPTMPAWLSAFFQRSRTDDAPVPVPVDAPVSDPLIAPQREETRIRLTALYRHSVDSAAARRWKNKPAARVLRTGPTIDEHLQKDAEITDPYEQEKFHIDYLTIRSASKYGWDTCAACYFQDPNSIVDTKTGKLEKHFNNNHHEDEKPKRCKVCDALFHSQRLKGVFGNPPAPRSAVLRPGAAPNVATPRSQIRGAGRFGCVIRGAPILLIRGAACRGAAVNYDALPPPSEKTARLDSILPQARLSPTPRQVLPTRP